MFAGHPAANFTMASSKISSEELLELMGYLGLTLSACGALAVLSLWWIRSRLPDAHPLRWWETVSMIVYLIITGAILAASWKTHHDQFIAMLLTFALGGIVYIAWIALESRGSIQKS